jgi:rhodanese-related sulfurtransferase
MKPQKNEPIEALAYFRMKLAFTTGPVELSQWIENKEPVNVVDVRAPEAYAKSHIPGAVNLPKDRWDSLQGLAKEKLNVLYCYSQVCHLAAAAAAKLAAEGYSVMELEGGFAGWEDNGLKIETGVRELAGVRS